jgi:hypothetical protein
MRSRPIAVVRVLAITSAMVMSTTCLFGANVPTGYSSTSNTTERTLSQQGSQLKTGDKGGTASDKDKAPPRENTQIFENYPKCYGTLISDGISRSEAELEMRKMVIKKFCRGIVNVKNQRKFSDCFYAAMGSNNYTSSGDIDAVVEKCAAATDKDKQSDVKQ